ncbi:hypothetical protein D3C75_621790 [compost metagenome]
MIILKKFISGVIVGALLFGGVSVFADGIGLVGKKVSGTYTIVKDGKKIADAAIIDGSAYAPVRAISEAAGVPLSVKGKEILMQNTSVAENNNGQAVNQTNQNPTKEELIAAIEKKKTHIDEFKASQVNYWETLIKENPNSTTVPKWQTALDKAKVQLQQLQQELADLEARLAALKN